MADPRTEATLVPSAFPATRADQRRALWVVGVSFALFLAAAPFAKVPQGRFVPFIALYESALVFNDVITAMLLFGFYRVFRNGAYLVLGCGYLFTAGMAFTHALTFPGLFSQTGLLGAGEQSTAWLYMFWHGGFPLAVMGYAALSGRQQSHRGTPRLRRPLFAGVAATLALVALFSYLATGLEAWLPRIMRGDRYTGEMPLVVRTAWGLSLAALAFLWIRRPHTVLDVWLMVVLCAWLFDIALAAVINQGRFDFGFYAGRIYGLFAVSFVLFVLLSENSKLLARLLEMHREAHRASRAKDLFLAMVGHELRNPLTSLSAGIHLLQRTLPGEPVHEETKALLERQMKHLARLVEDLVDAGRAAGGKLSIERRRLDLAAVVHAAVEAYRLSERLERHPLEIDVAPVGVEADPHRVEQMVGNLLTNAVKYTPAGKPIRVSVRTEGGHAVLSVSDEGIGMRPEELKRAFDWFYQANDALDRAQGGLGLGLALVRAIAELHGGTVDAESDLGKGSRFIIRLPAAA